MRLAGTNNVLEEVAAKSVIWAKYKLFVEGDIGEDAIVFLQGGGAQLTVHGNVSKNARVFVSGGGARATLRSYAGRATCICVNGGRATIYTRYATQNIHVRGGSAEIKYLWPLSLVKRVT
ncbi:MAG: hypothetical protein WBP12_01150 [Candidatus Saccharimonas sp.]